VTLIGDTPHFALARSMRIGRSERSSQQHSSHSPEYSRESQVRTAELPRPIVQILTERSRTSPSARAGYCINALSNAGSPLRALYTIVLVPQKFPTQPGSAHHGVAHIGELSALQCESQGRRPCCRNAGGCGNAPAFYACPFNGKRRPSGPRLTWQFAMRAYSDLLATLAKDACANRHG
jgi:hypothetical protein